MLNREVVRFAHREGTRILQIYEADKIRMVDGIVELVKTHHYAPANIPEDALSVMTFDEVVAQIALGPGQSVSIEK